VLTKLAAYSSWQSAPLVPLGERGPQMDLIQIRKIEGLGPVTSDINTSPFGSVDGESYTGSHTPKRNIVMTVGLNPDWNNWSMESLRRALYAYFMPKQTVHLVFQSDDDFPDVWIDGYVEGFEPDIFNKDVEIQISIICPDPYFTAVEPTVLTANVGLAPRLVKYNGSIETGYTVKVTQTVAPGAAYIVIRSGNPYTSKLGVYATINATKYFLMSSVAGNKYVSNVELNTGIITNLLGGLDADSVWPVLKPGDNWVQILSEQPTFTTSYELTYFEKFGGL
jgi:predicted phage tail component-like protein